MIGLVKKNPLYFAFFFPAFVDGTMTFIGQDPLYWSSRVVNEASPAYFFLKTSPYLYVLGSIVWFIFWYWLMKRLKEPINLFFTFLFIAGNSWGSASWIWKLMRDNGLYYPGDQTSIIFAWTLVVLYFSLIAFFATYSLRVYFRKNNLSPD